MPELHSVVGNMSNFAESDNVFKYQKIIFLSFYSIHNIIAVFLAHF